MTQQFGTTPLQQAGQHHGTDLVAEGGQTILPVVEEQLDIRKVTVETGAVRIRKIVHEDVQAVPMTLMHEQVSVTRVAANRVVAETFGSRQEGDTLVIPVFREVLTRQLLLVEEVRVTTHRSPEPSTQQVTMKREEAVVERYDAETGSWSPDPSL